MTPTLHLPANSRSNRQQTGQRSKMALHLRENLNRSGSAEPSCDLPSGEGVTLGRLREFILLPQEKVNGERKNWRKRKPNIKRTDR
jgi:hypothetical protein